MISWLAPYWTLFGHFYSRLGVSLNIPTQNICETRLYFTFTTNLWGEIFGPKMTKSAIFSIFSGFSNITVKLFIVGTIHCAFIFRSYKGACFPFFAGIVFSWIITKTGLICQIYIDYNVIFLQINWKCHLLTLYFNNLNWTQKIFGRQSLKKSVKFLQHCWKISFQQFLFNPLLHGGGVRSAPPS